LRQGWGVDMVSVSPVPLRQKRVINMYVRMDPHFVQKI